MTMQDTATIAASWLEWGSAYGLPEPSYVTLSAFDGFKAINFQFGDLGHVHDWARYLRVNANGHAKDGDLFTRAKYNTGDYELVCYSVTPFTPVQPTLDDVAERQAHEDETAAQWGDVARGEASRPYTVDCDGQFVDER